MYSQLLCGIYQNDTVVRVGTIFCYGLILVIRFLEEHWTLLCNDIRTGTINKRISDPLVRQGIMRAILLNPNPVLADFIEMQCNTDNSSSWKGIIPRLWPNTKYIETIVTGSNSKYISALDYYSNGLPIVSARYCSSEGHFSLNLNPLCKPNEISYTLIPTMAYFEFLPVEKNDIWVNNSPNSVGDEHREKAQEELVHLVDVKLGQEYELVVTTIAGHYVLYWELHSIGNSHAATQNDIPSSVFEDCCMTIEESLNYVYRAHHFAGAIGALEIKAVKQGSFRKMMEHAKSIGTSISQYKTPGCLKSISMVDLMNSMVVINYFSPKCPYWVSGNNLNSE
ncbi:indole-3-acetic acid-amido synthetase GH3.5-like [Papaver somniferum]|uniref:indole-3-acetic acid-amido synthetase GH3.5-like n=1 Tax=Papaver somniferum TaxID=3469 RepID=UPI000E704FEA|nr:indole-3-acetic acid-amido synthetase GH3.5-like [Papaver somniferum]